MSQQASEYVSPRDVASRLGVSRETVLRWVRQGILPAIKIGQTIRISRARLDRWLTEQEVEAGW